MFSDGFDGTCVDEGGVGVGVTDGVKDELEGLDEIVGWGFGIASEGAEGEWGSLGGGPFLRKGSLGGLFITFLTPNLGGAFFGSGRERLSGKLGKLGKLWVGLGGLGGGVMFNGTWFCKCETSTVVLLGSLSGGVGETGLLGCFRKELKINMYNNIKRILPCFVLLFH